MISRTRDAAVAGFSRLLITSKENRMILRSAFRTHTPGRSAFTLIELLVVIASSRSWPQFSFPCLPRQEKRRGKRPA
jgi:hypothetical protein